MTRTRGSQPDPIEHELELALNPGTFISYRECFSFVSDLDAVAAKVAGLVSSEPVRAVTRYETFLAACYLKVEELDDSSGCFGQLVGELYCGWLTARRAAGADPDETALSLLSWMEEDEYGFCHQLETDLVRVFDKANLAAFVKLVRARYEAAAQKTENEDDQLWDGPNYLRRRWGEVLRTLYTAQKDLAAYVSLAEETGLTAMDCHAVARLLVTRRKPEEALAWVERGFEVDRQTPHGSTASYDLAKLERVLLARLGRDDEALDAAWTDYCAQPSINTYAELMKYVPKEQRVKWHDTAIEAATGANLRSIMDLLLRTRELDRLAELVQRTTDDDLERLSHHATEPVATKLEKPRPDLAARLWRAQGLRIVNAKKSTYYDAALSNLERAKHCFERAGLAEEWRQTVRQVRADHHRKSSFMPGFERLVAGVGPSDEPSFLELAKARWSAKGQLKASQGSGPATS